MSFWREMLSDDKGHLSSRIVYNGVGVLVGSLVVLYLAFFKELGVDIFACFILATGGVYSIGRVSDNSVERERLRAENPQPPAPVIAPVPNTVIQVGGDKTGAVNDMNVTAQGAVNVTGGQE